MKIWTVEDIAARFDEAFDVLSILPSPKSLGYAKRWPITLYLPRELERQAPAAMRIAATPQQVTRMEETLTWITWVEPDVRHLIWLRAEALPWRTIACQRNLSKTTAQRYWQQGLQVIADKLTQMNYQSLASDPMLLVV